MIQYLGVLSVPFLHARWISLCVLIISVSVLAAVSNSSVAQPPEGGYMGGGLGDPPAAGTIPVLTKDDLQTRLANHIVATRFCANSQDYCTCCSAGGPCSTASSKASGMCGIAPDSSGAGGGSTEPVALTSLARGAASGGGGLMGSPAQSMTVNVSAHALHVAKDYFMPPAGDSASGCATCGGGGGGDGGANGGSCLDFMMIRQNRGRDQTEQSSFGPGWFGSYDLKLHMNSDEVGHVDVFDPSDLAPRRFLKSGSGSMVDLQDVNDGSDVAANDPLSGDGMFVSFAPQYGSGGTSDPAGVWTREAHGVIKSLEMYDANGVLTGTRATAATAVVTNFDGVKFVFQVFQIEDVPGGAGDAPTGGGGGTSGCGAEPLQSNYPTWAEYYSAWDTWYMCVMMGTYSGGGGSSTTTVDNDRYEARLIKIADRNEKAVTIAYKQWTVAQIAESPDRQWQIDTVTDAKGRTSTFSYGAQQVGGRWAVSQITVPGGDTIQYEYASGKLSHVVRPGGSESTFSTSFDSTIQHVKMNFSDPVSDGANRQKEVWLTSNFVEITHGGTASGFFNQSSQLVRAIINADNTVGQFAMSGGDGTWIDQWIYEGGGSLKRILNWAETKYAVGWDLRVDSSNNKLGFAVEYEPTYATVWNSAGAWQVSQPAGATQTNGVRVDYEYDTAGFTKKIIFGDGTYETAEYNDLHQVTRHRDRGARVTKYTYDSKGNRLTKEVGILEVSTWMDEYHMEPPVVSDVVQPEHAIYQWEYYPVGHVNAGLLKTEFDPLWGGSSPDTHRTDYEYNTYDQITKKLGSASVTGQVRPETNSTYNAKRQLVSVVDPEGHTTQYAYDLQNRLTKSSYDDASTEETLYGAGGTPQDGLVVKTKDRRNVVTSYTYDLAGRPTQIVVASAWDSSILDGQPDDTPITDRNQQSITNYTYVAGTDRPASVTRDGAKTDFVYDYRGRVVQTKVYPYAGKTLISKKQYLNNQLFADEDPYGRKTYYGYRVSDGAMVRVVKAAYPSEEIDPNDPMAGMGGGYMGGGFSPSNNLSVLSVARDTNLNPQYTIKDSITDSSGNLWQIVDERGTVTESTFNSRGQATVQLAAKGTAVEAKTATLYDADGNAIEVRTPRYFDANDPNGFEKCRTVMTYDGAGRVLSRTEAPGTAEAGTESYTYDTSGRQKTRTDARGKVWTTSYASCCGHSVASRNPLGHGSISNQNAGGLTVHTAGIADVDTHSSMLNPVDAKTLQETTTKYDALGRSVASTVWLQALGLVDVANPPIAGFAGIAGTQGLTTQTLYDADLTDNVGLEVGGGISVTNPLGGTYNVSLSAAIAKLGQPIAQGGAGITFAAGTPGSAVVQLNAENEVSFSISDAQGRSLMSGILHPHDTVAPNTPGTLLTWSCNVPDTTETIDSKVYLTSLSVDALGNSTKSRSNGLGRTLQSVDQGGNVSTVQYDAGGSAIVSRDPNNVGQDCVYDQLGRRTACTDTVGSLTQTGYDKSGQQITATDGKNKVTTYVFDARGRRRKEIDRLTYPTEWSYDADGNLLSLKDAENQITSYSYNDAGQRITEQYPDHVSGTTIGQAGYGIITFGYDALGRKISKQDQQGDITSYNFDKSSRILTRGYVGHASGPLAGQANTDTFTYDRSGRMLSGIKGRYNNTVTFAYDDRGQQTQETLTTHGQTYTVSYIHNTLGQTTRLVYPDGSLVDRSYTNRGQLQSVNYTPLAGAVSSVATFTYDAGGRETQRNLGNGLTTTHGYFADNQIQSIATPTVETLTYTYDANKNPTSESRSGVMAPYSWTTGPTGYDFEDRLTNWSRTNGDSQSWNLSPVHDWQTTSINGAVQTRTHGPAHEILTMSGADVTSSPRTLQHDTKGNMTTDDRGCNMAWDFDNMLQTFTANGVTNLRNVTYEYDAVGRRVRKQTQEQNSSTQALSIINAGSQSIAEQWSDGFQVKKRQYLYASYIDDLLYFDDLSSPTRPFWLSSNRQYTTTQILNINTAAEFSFALSHNLNLENVSNSESTPQSLLWSAPAFLAGNRIDAEMGTSYARNRIVSGRSTRYMSRDPAHYLDGLSLYAAYYGLRATDPTGLSEKCRLRVLVGHNFEVKQFLDDEYGVDDWPKLKGGDDIIFPVCCGDGKESACEIIGNKAPCNILDKPPTILTSADSGVNGMLYQEYCLSIKAAGDRAREYARKKHGRRVRSKKCDEPDCDPLVVEVLCSEEFASVLNNQVFPGGEGGGGIPFYEYLLEKFKAKYPNDPNKAEIEARAQAARMNAMFVKYPGCKGICNQTATYSGRGPDVKLSVEGNGGLGF